MLGQERMQKIAKENEEYAKKLAEAEKKRIEEKKKYTDEMLRLEEEQSSLRIAATSTGYKELENIITENYSKGPLSRKEYDEAMRELERKAANEQLQIQIDAC